MSFALGFSFGSDPRALPKGVEIVRHEVALALDIVVALVNSDDHRTGCDALTTVEELCAFLDQHLIDRSQEVSDADLRSVRSLRRRLRAVFEAAVTDDQASAVAEVNTLIAHAQALPCLVAPDGGPPHFRYNSIHDGLLYRLEAASAIGIGTLIAERGLDRLRVCGSPGCRRVLVDLSRNSSRRYCDSRCGNRQHVAAYRSRLDQSGKRN